MDIIMEKLFSIITTNIKIAKVTQKLLEILRNMDMV